jgi:hypothetical protein
MSKAWSRAGVALLALAVVLLFGACGGLKQAAQKKQKENQLRVLGLMYFEYHDMKGNGRGPSNANDLQKLPSVDAAAYAALQRGDFVLIWDASIPASFPQGTSNTVLGYEASAPTNGGLVLMGDGSVQEMTAAQFQAAPKPQPKPAN